MDFSDALLACKAGSFIQRSGWNDENMFVGIQVPDVNSKMTLPYLFRLTIDGPLVPWLPSQTDLLAGDWIENQILLQGIITGP